MLLKAGLSENCIQFHSATSMTDDVIGGTCQNSEKPVIINLKSLKVPEYVSSFSIFKSVYNQNL